MPSRTKPKLTAEGTEGHRERGFQIDDCRFPDTDCCTAYPRLLNLQSKISSPASSATQACGLRRFHPAAKPGLSAEHRVRSAEPLPLLPRSTSSLRQIDPSLPLIRSPWARS